MDDFVSFPETLDLAPFLAPNRNDYKVVPTSSGPRAPYMNWDMAGHGPEMKPVLYRLYGRPSRRFIGLLADGSSRRGPPWHNGWRSLHRLLPRRSREDVCRGWGTCRRHVVVVLEWRSRSTFRIEERPTGVVLLLRVGFSRMSLIMAHWNVVPLSGWRASTRYCKLERICAL